jgi:hypothetical protein
MPYFRKIKAGLVKNEITEHVGEEGTLFFDVETGAFRISDGVTPGGTLLGGYGLMASDISTDSTFAANSDSFIPSQRAVKTAVLLKQDLLVSGSNIKTINAQSLLGSGNLTIGTLKTRSGVVLVGEFAGNPKVATVTFPTALPTVDYSISITSEDSRFWTFENKTVDGFTINANANAALTSDVTYIAIEHGEN